jgi:hypothetical protein
MNENYEIKVNKRKTKLFAASCLAVAITLTAGIAIVANAATKEEGKMLAKTENGQMSYSTDDGQTWTQGAPDGAVVTTDENGGSLVTMGTPPEGDDNAMMARNENGEMSYSTDGGKTWSENALEGYDVNTGEDGSVSIQRR